MKVRFLYPFKDLQSKWKAERGESKTIEHLTQDVAIFDCSFPMPLDLFFKITEPVAEKTTKPSAKKFDFKKALLANGVEESVANDWLVVRRNKKASNTETAFNGVVNQVNQLEGVTLNQAIKFATEMNWSGFKANWYLNEAQKNPQIAVSYKSPSEVISAVKSGQITHVNQIPSEFKSLIETQLRLGKVKPETAELLNKIGMIV